MEGKEGRDGPVGTKREGKTRKKEREDVALLIHRNNKVQIVPHVIGLSTRL